MPPLPVDNGRHRGPSACAVYVRSADNIAGVPLVEIARQFGTPTFVYDAAMIRQRIADLAAFDVVRYRPEGVLESRHPGPRAPPRGAGRRGQRAARSAAPWPAGYALPPASPPPIVYTADIFDAESLDLCVEQTSTSTAARPT